VSGGTILLVDDEPLIARLHARAVQAMGFTPTFAVSGEEALEVIASTPPVIVLTDLHMGGIDGLALSHAIKSRIERPPPVVLVSGDDTVGILDDGLAAGVDDFLVKGMPFALLTERVRFWADGPFRALPVHIRAQARETLARVSPIGPPLTRLRSPADLLFERAQATMVDLLAEAPDGFGMGDMDRVRFLGVLDQVLATLSRSSALAQLRRADTMVAIIQSLDLLWRARLLRDDLPRLDALVHDATFRHAAETLTLRL
jgi:CheY-like chemotaxis protein